MSTHYVITEHTPDVTSGYVWLAEGTTLLDAAVLAGQELANHTPDSRVRLVEVTVPPSARGELDEFFAELDAEDAYDAMPALWESPAAKLPLYDSATRNWLASAEITIDAMKVAWESQIGILETEDERVAAANALMEGVIALVGLPLDLDSLDTRQIVYRLIIGADSVKDLTS